MEKIDSLNEIIDNCYQFNYAIKNSNSIPYKRFKQFYDWYYFPQFNLFAPNKFIGYKETTAYNYTGKGTGTETTQALSKFFYKVNRGSKQFNEYKNKLDIFAKSLNKDINKKTYFGSGGIFLLKEEYLNKDISYTDTLFNAVASDLESQEDEDAFSPSLEGEKKEKLISYYERKPILRARAIAYHGLTCTVCGFNYEKYYGEWGKNFIEVHHLYPISNFDKEIEVNPKTDMTVLCSNCHRMIHRKRNQPLKIEELKKLLYSNAS